MNTSLPISIQRNATSAPSIFERLSGGDAGAFKDFVDQYGNWVACVVRRSLGWRTADFDDAMQDAMLALWKAAPQYDRTRGAETTYIGTIVRHLMMDRQRKASIRDNKAASVSLELALAEGTGSEVDADGEGLEGNDSRHPDQSHHLHSALNRLQPEERELVELAIVGGKTHAQIAQATGLPAEKVKRTISRVLARLRQDLTSRKVAA